MLNNSDLIASLDYTEESHGELEAVCNIGAAELLMPSTLIRTSVRDLGLSPEGLLTLYDRFLVSTEALLWRIASTMPHSSITKWREHARNSNEEKCFRVMSCYPPYEKGNTRPWLPEGVTTKHLNSDIVERVAFQKKPEYLANLEIELGDRVWSCEAVTTFFADRKRKREQPQFEGFAVPDEKLSSKAANILVFAAKRHNGSRAMMKM
jgi:hypothetical protein